VLGSVLLWCSAVFGVVLLVRPATSNAGLLALAGSALALLFHYHVATVPEVQGIADLLWLAAALLLGSRFFAGRRRRTV
jgi:hypothetical protein